MKKRKHNSKLLTKKIVVPLVAAASVAFVAQLTFDIYAVQRLHDRPNNVPITQLIVNAVYGLSKPAPVDAKTGQSYLPEARLVFPATQYAGNQLRYGYNVYGSKQAEITITTSGLLGRGTAALWSAAGQPATSDKDASAHMFAMVPNLQACARGVQIYQEKQVIENTDYRFLYAPKLTDGRTLYAYLDSGCHEDTTDLVKIVKQVQSY